METTNFSRTTWRLVNTGISDGATNMAVDEAIMLSVSEDRSPPTLRFYGWEPPCVSIGYNQSLKEEVDLEKCRIRGYNWVRRPTGGRAVLHIDELTYSVVAPMDEPRVYGDILTSYRRISLGLLAGLQSIGGTISQADRKEKDSEKKSAACFEVPSHYEVTALGRKLVGSAQVRRMGVVLQHGSLPLTGDASRLVEVLKLPEMERERLRQVLHTRAIALDEALGKKVPFQEAAEAIESGFRETLNLDFEKGALSDYEIANVERLKHKYLGSEWTFNK
jgi:lipoate-protein ligase A